MNNETIGHAEQWYDNYTGQPCENYTGHPDYPGPEVTGTDEVNEPNIFIERCGQGFLVYVGQDKLAFTDGLDAAEWVLGWLGFEHEIVESVSDILAGLWDADELVDRDGVRLLDIAQAALAYVEGQYGLREGKYDELCEP